MYILCTICIAYPFWSPCVDNLSPMIHAESQHSFLSSKHAIERPITAPIRVYGIWLSHEHGLATQHLSSTLPGVVDNDATVFTIGDVKSVLGRV